MGSCGLDDPFDRIAERELARLACDTLSMSGMYLLTCTLQDVQRECLMVQSLLLERKRMVADRVEEDVDQLSRANVRVYVPILRVDEQSV